MNNIFFILNDTKDNSSSYIKKNIFDKLINKNCNLVYDIPNTINSICYFLKKRKKRDLVNIYNLKNNNNYLIYEPLDSKWNLYNNIIEYYIENKNYFNLFDEIICNSEFMIYKLREVGCQSKLSLNYHEYDENYKSTNIINNDVIYLGILDKCSFEIKDLNKYDIKHIDNFNGLYNISIHIDFLLNNKLYYTLHTSTKLSTAMCLNCIFICNRIPVYVELLGNEYEFYINDDLSNINEIINNAKNMLNNRELYNQYLEKYLHVKNKLSPNNILSNYKEILYKNFNLNINKKNKKNKKNKSNKSDNKKIINKILIHKLK